MKDENKEEARNRPFQKKFNNFGSKRSEAVGNELFGCQTLSADRVIASTLKYEAFNHTRCMVKRDIFDSFSYCNGLTYGRVYG